MLGDPLERGDGVAQPAQAGGIVRRPHYEKVVVHHQPAAHEVARVRERTLGLGRMREDHIGIPATPHLEGLPAADCDHLHVVAGALLEQRQQAVEQPGVAGAGGGGEKNLGGLNCVGWSDSLTVGQKGGAETEPQSDHQNRACIWTMSLLFVTAGPCSVNSA